jgi:hypothetical protein
MGNSPIINWQFSIAMLVYQRVPEPFTRTDRRWKGSPQEESSRTTSTSAMAMRQGLPVSTNNGRFWKTFSWTKIKKKQHHESMLECPYYFCIYNIYIYFYIYIYIHFVYLYAASGCCAHQCAMALQRLQPLLGLADFGGPQEGSKTNSQHR